MALPSSSSTSRWKYDVFLSFSGKDTRTNFTDHLYAALNRSGIYTFRDDNELERGREIEPELLKAIEDSRFSIIVFSRDYTSSRWCLDELAHIIKCKKTLGQTVIPVFYDVDPSDVPKLKRSFEEAFGGHEEMDKLERWRAALREAADLSGYPVDRHESTIIENIVKDISNKLPKRLSVIINPVDLPSRANAVISLLYDESIEGCVVGIYGMGGIGKTTIAKEVYNSMISKFEASCFLANVREISNSKGTVHLQKQLLSEILKGKHEEIYNVDRGLKVIEERLQSMRVLIVLDDVDKYDQLTKMLGNLHWLCRGSKIIITTRIKDLLPSRFYRQYQVMELDQEESLRLFSINAFGEWHPMEEYMEWAKRVVHYAGGIPLALEVLGSSLYGVRDLDEWKCTWEKLKEIPHNEIQEKLKISYYSLPDDMVRDIFLDIACFFTRKDKDYVIRILDGCDFHPIAGINTLTKRCLIKIDSHNKLVMHDLLQDMGREIVRQECPKEPGNRSRVWRHKEAFDLLTDETGTQAVEGLSLNLQGLSELSAEAFREMKNLRLLQLKNVNLTGSYKHISKKLRWLCWHECPLESIPADLHMRNVVALDMRYSSLKQVWEEVKSLQKLKFLNLSHSHKLTKTPDFTGLPILEILMLKDCTSLAEVHESIGHLTKLVILNLKDCRNLKNLPRSICELRSLKNLNISGCSEIDELPEELGNIESLVVLTADGTPIKLLPKTIANSENLISLSLRGCKWLTQTPSKGPSLISLMPNSLTELDLRWCNLSDDMIPDDLQNLSQLENLYLSGNNFSSLPASMGRLLKLTRLILDDCRRLQSVPMLPSDLFLLRARNCTSLERINASLKVPILEVDGCHNLVEIEGAYKLEPIEVENVEKLLGNLGLSIEVSLASVRVHMFNTQTGTHTYSSLQGLSERGIYSLFLPGISEIPSWFKHQSEGDSITFNVPPLQGCKITGFIICAVYAWEHVWEDTIKRFCIAFEIWITNKTKGYFWAYQPTFSFFSSEVRGDIMWLSRWSFENQTADSPFDNSWRFKNEMEGGDQVKVSILMQIPAKKCGVHLIDQQNDQAMIPRASSRHLGNIIVCPSLHYQRFGDFDTSYPR